MVSIPALNEGGLNDIMNGIIIPNPIFQVLACRRINNNQQRARYVLSLSDGKYSTFNALLATRSNFEACDLNFGDIITENSVIQLKKYTTGSIKCNEKNTERQIIVITNIDVLVNGDVVGKVIGLPNPLTQKSERTNQSDNIRIHGGKIIYPISSLISYKKTWFIKARVTNKSEIRTWSNSQGEGKLFTCDLIDESGDIRLTGFGDQVDKFYNFIQIDKVYYIGKYRVKPTNSRFNNLNNGYEMSMTNETIIEECENNNEAVSTARFNFVSLMVAANKPSGNVVDTIGVCTYVSDLDIFVTNNREIKKRTVTIVDQSNTSMNLTLWGSQAESFEGSNNPVVAIRGAKVSEFGGGKFLSTLMSSLIKINPDNCQCHRIRDWFDSVGRTTQMNNVSGRTGGSLSSLQSNWMCFKEVEDKSLGYGDCGEYYKVIATIVWVYTEDVVYKKCPTMYCNQEVFSKFGKYFCYRCLKELPNFKYGLHISMHLGDWTGIKWVTLFPSEIEKLYGKQSNEIGEIFENNWVEGSAFLQDVNFKQFAFTCRVKTDSYRERMKNIVVKVEPINYAERNSYLVKTMEQKFGYAS